jgi:hypothetical protein
LDGEQEERPATVVNARENPEEAEPHPAPLASAVAAVVAENEVDVEDFVEVDSSSRPSSRASSVEPWEVLSAEDLPPRQALASSSPISDDELYVV